MLGPFWPLRRVRAWLVASAVVVVMGSAAAPASARDPVIAYLNASHQLQMYDSQTGAAVSAPALTVKRFASFAVSFNGRYIAYIANSDGLIHLFDRVANAEIPLPGINIYTSGGAFPADLSVSDTGLIAFDNGGNGGVVVYNSATGNFIPTGLPPDGASGFHPRDPVLSGDGNFLATTCITGLGSTCPNDNLNSTHSTLFVQNLTTQTDTGLPFIDNSGISGTDEEHGCIDANGGLVGADAVDTGAQSNVYIFDRSTNSNVSINGLNIAGKNTVHCVLSFGGAYVGVSDAATGQVRVYDRAAGSQITIPVPSTVLPPIWFTAPFVPPKPPLITTPAKGAQLTENQVVDAAYSCSDPSGGMGIASCAGPVATGSAIDTSTPGTHKFTVTATDVNGLTDATTSTYTVVLTGGATPVVTHVRQSHRVWRERKGHKPGLPVGTTFSFVLNAAANVRLTFTRRVAGRKVDGKCVAKTHKNRHARRCRLPSSGTLSFNGHSGPNRRFFKGTVAGRKKLKPGPYTLTITATNAAGQKSKPQSVRFSIAK